MREALGEIEALLFDLPRVLVMAAPASE